MVLIYSNEAGLRERPIPEENYIDLQISDFKGSLFLRQIDLRLRNLGTYYLEIFDPDENKIAETRKSTITSNSFNWKSFKIYGTINVEPYQYIRIKIKYIDTNTSLLAVTNKDQFFCDQSIKEIVPLIKIWSIGTGEERRSLDFNPYTSLVEFSSKPVDELKVDTPILPPTEPTDEIQQKLSEIDCEKGGRVYLGSGLFPILNTIDIPCDNVALVGTEGSTIVSGSDCSTVIQAIGKKNIRLEQITVVSPSECICSGDGILLSGSTFSKILDCQAIGLGKSGIKLNNCNSITLERNLSKANHHFGIIVKDSRFIRLINNQTLENWGSGVIIQDSDRVSLFDSASRTNNDDGVLIWGSYITHLRNNYLNENRCGAGIDIRDGTNTYITENETYDNQYGIFGDEFTFETTLTNNLSYSNYIKDILLMELEEQMLLIKFAYASPVSIAPGSSRFLELDSGDAGAEIVSMTFSGLINSAWKVEVFIPVTDGILTPSNIDKKNELIYKIEDDSGGQLVNIGGIRYNCFIKFTNLSSSSQTISKGIISYYSPGSIELQWES